MPDEQASHDRGHKYPYVACEIFTCDNYTGEDRILDLFFQSRFQKEGKLFEIAPNLQSGIKREGEDHEYVTVELPDDKELLIISD